MFFIWLYQGFFVPLQCKFKTKEIRVMITAEQAKAFTKPFVPNKEHIDEIERQIKKGERHIMVWTTSYVRSYAEDLAKYCREHGYATACIKDIYSIHGVRGGNYLSIELD